MSRTSSPQPRSPLWLVIAFLGGVLVLFMGISFAQEVRRRLVLKQHVQKLQQEIQTREQRIANLQQLTEYLRTDAYQERAAREKLNYQQPQERVIVIPESGAVREAEVERGADERRRQVSIPRQWWELFFGTSTR